MPDASATILFIGDVVGGLGRRRFGPLRHGGQKSAVHGLALSADALLLGGGVALPALIRGAHHRGVVHLQGFFLKFRLLFIVKHIKHL